MMNRPPMQQDPRLAQQGMGQAFGQGYPQPGPVAQGFGPTTQGYGPQGFGPQGPQGQTQAFGPDRGPRPAAQPGQLDLAELRNRMQGLAAQLPPAARQALAQLVQLLEADYAERHAGLEQERSMLQAAAETLAEVVLGHAPGHIREKALAAGHPDLSSKAHRKLAAAAIHHTRKLAAREFARSDPAHTQVLRLMQEYVQTLPPQVGARLTDILEHDPAAFLELYHQTRAQMGSGSQADDRVLAATTRRITKAPLLASAGADSGQPGSRQVKAAKLAARIKAGRGDIDDFADYLEASGVVDRMTSAAAH